MVWWLEHDGHDVILVEQAGYMLDCQGPGYDAVERMGLLPRLRERAFLLSELVYHHHDGSVRDRFTDAGPAADRMVSLMRGNLEEILHEGLTSRCEIRFGTEIGRAHV